MFGAWGDDGVLSPRYLRAALGLALKPTSMLGCAAAVACTAGVLHKYSLAHPFLLADNRHFTFYVWGRFLGRIPWLKEVGEGGVRCAVRRGAVRCGAVRCGAVRCGAVR